MNITKARADIASLEAETRRLASDAVGIRKMQRRVAPFLFVSAALAVGSGAVAVIRLLIG